MMKRKDRLFFLKAVIIVLIALPLSLPCSVKRELKRILDIPVAEHPFKSNRAVTVCQISPVDHPRQTLSVLQKKKEFLPDLLWYRESEQSVLLLYLCNTIFLENEPVCSIPFYILHQQYRS